MKQYSVLILATPTPGDPSYFARWEATGMRVYRDGDSINPAEITVLVVDQRNSVTAEVIRWLPKLKIVASVTTGHTHLQLDPKKLGVKLITLRGEAGFLESVRSVSELTFLFILKLAREGRDIGTTLRDKTIGILGLGRIGRHVQELARAFRMNILTFDQGGLDPEVDLSIIFQYSDFVTIHLSETQATRKMVSRELIRMMKPSAYLINTARGSIVDEDALAQALREKRIAGAALDVTENPGLFSNLPNVIRTPHIGGSTIEDRIRTDELMIKRVVAELSQYSS